MKKLLCLFLAILMLFSLCSCLDEVGPDTDEVRGEISTNEDNESNEKKTEEKKTEEKKTEEKVSLGKTESHTYTNKYLGLSCTLPADWTFLSEKELLEKNNLVGEVMTDDLAKQLENASIIYDLSASYQDGMQSININLEKVNVLQAATLDVKKALEDQIEGIKETYKSIGYTNTKVEYKKVTVDGQEFDALVLSAEIQGYSFYTTIFSFLKGNYMANVAVASLLTDETATLLSYFDVK